MAKNTKNAHTSFRFSEIDNFKIEEIIAETGYNRITVIRLGLDELIDAKYPHIREKIRKRMESERNE